jgi:NAD(P)-dependent dehydrogenase (short-subunit alcohol dehydrogenase family)
MKPTATQPMRIIVTGGATNIGRAITEAFLSQGARVAVGQPDPEIARPLLDRFGDRVMALPLDAGNPESCAAFVAAAAAGLGGVDVLVNNAAITGPGTGRLLAEIDAAHFRRIIDVNLGGVLFCSQAAVPHLRKAGGGVIIHLSSINAIRPQRGAMVYAASKAAVTSLAHSMAKELAADKIRVIAVAPGDIATEQSAQLTREMAARGIVSDVAGQTPLGQGAPEDIGAVVAFLCSPAARYVTGTTWLVDGGLLA